MILVDTSAWVEYDGATGSPVHRRLRQLIAQGQPLATTQPVVMEVVAGARDAEREQDLRRMLSAFTLLPFEGAVDLDGAARVYRSCRTAGVTPRGLLDCMIAAVALRFEAVLLAHDSDFHRIAGVVSLDLDVASS